MYLVDTNIFLEILLKQEKSKECKKFLEKNIGKLNITDFSLHSIGVILFKQNKDELFLKFINDTLPKTDIVSLPKNQYYQVIDNKRKLGLDFDDSYQYSICKNYGFKLKTMDQDFQGIENIDVLFL